jgi:predicted DNA-binding protein (UPF0251 family)
MALSDIPTADFEKAVKRFWSKVQKTEDGCWTWLGSTDRYGNSSFYYWSGRKRFRAFAHRFSYELHIGPVPDRRALRHSCGNPLCVNPAHLELSSSQRCKLDEAKVSQILNELSKPNPMSSRQLADLHQVSHTAINIIRRGITWKTLERPRSMQKPGPPKGSSNCSAKLSEKDVVQIRQLAAEGMTQAIIARRFGISQTTVSAILRGKAWGHLRGEA